MIQTRTPLLVNYFWHHVQERLVQVIFKKVKDMHYSNRSVCHSKHQTPYTFPYLQQYKYKKKTSKILFWNFQAFLLFKQEFKIRTFSIHPLYRQSKRKRFEGIICKVNWCNIFMMGRVSWGRRRSFKVDALIFDGDAVYYTPHRYGKLPLKLNF